MEYWEVSDLERENAYAFFETLEKGDFLIDANNRLYEFSHSVPPGLMLVARMVSHPFDLCYFTVVSAARHQLRKITNEERAAQLGEPLSFPESVNEEVAAIVRSLELTAGSSILVVGPGCTPMQFELARQQHLVYVSEKNSATMARIRGTAQALGLERTMIFPHECDIAEGHLAQNSFDLVVCLSVLDLFSNVQQKGIARKLLFAMKDGGRIIIGHHDPIAAVRVESLMKTVALDLNYSLVQCDLQSDFHEGCERESRFYPQCVAAFKVCKQPLDVGETGADEQLSLGDVLLQLHSGNQ